MSRTLYPATLAFGAGATGTALTSARGSVVTIYTDSALTTPANLSLTLAGAAITSGQLTVTAGSEVPDFYGPDGFTGTLYAAGVGGLAVAIYPVSSAGGGAVASVNGHTGTVVLVASDVGADPVGAAAAVTTTSIGAATAAGLTAETAARVAADALKADLVAGLVPTSQIPALALVNAVPVASQAAMLALTSSQVQPGDVAVRSDGAGTFMLTATPPSTLGNWTLLNAPTDLVVSVNGQVGTVVLAKGDVGLGNVTNTSDASKPVSTAQQTALDLKANLSGGAAFTGGAVTVPNRTAGDNTTSAANTAFVTSAVAAQSAVALWAATTAYALNQIVLIDSTVANGYDFGEWQCLVAHTSGSTFSGTSTGNWKKLAGDSASSSAVTIVEHGSTAGTARPTGAVRVFWRGTVTPTNMALWDRFVDVTAPAAPIEKICISTGPVVCSVLGFTPTGGELPFLEGLANQFDFGHSYLSGTNDSAGSRWPDRVSGRLRPGTHTNTGVQGITMAVAAQKVITQWTPAARGLALIQCTYNDANMFSTTTGPPTTAEGLRAALAFLTCGAAYGYNSSSAVYTGAGWATTTNAAYYGGNAKRTTTVGDCVDLSVNGDGCYILTTFVGDSSGGTITVTHSGTGATLATTTTTGYDPLLTATIGTPGVIKITGLGPGVHTIRATLTAGTGFTFNAVLIPNPYPPTLVFAKEGPTGSNTVSTRLTTNYWPAIDPVIAAFSTAYATPSTGPVGWTYATMIGEDGIHPNQRGHDCIATTVVNLLSALTWREGQNHLQVSFSNTPSAPAYAASTMVDTFNRADTATGLGTTSDTLGTWGATTGFRVLSNKCQAIAAAGDNTVAVDTSLANCTVAATLKATGDGGLVARWTDNNNYWMAWAGGGGGTWQLEKKSAGSYSAAGGSVVVATVGDLVQLVCTSAGVALVVNGVTLATAADVFNVTATRHGFRNGAANPAAWDDFSAS